MVCVKIKLNYNLEQSEEQIGLVSLENENMVHPLHCLHIAHMVA